MLSDDDIKQPALHYAETLQQDGDELLRTVARRHDDHIRQLQNGCYVLGAVSFEVGSIVFMPAIANVAIGGWLFTLGSSAFVAMDLLQLSLENVTIGEQMKPMTVVSFLGSILFLIGSILFIPAQTVVLGTKLFIVGCGIFTALAGWKLFNDKLLRLTQGVTLISSDNHDHRALWVTALGGLGAVLFLIGSVLYLPDIDVNRDTDWTAWAFFQVGSTLYTVSAILSWMSLHLSSKR
jgi:hypothetical protein